MNLLLDTHIFLWFVFADPQLSANARSLVEDKATVKFLSMASIWEMAIKYSINKLPLALPFDDFLNDHIAPNGIVLLPIAYKHLLQISTLPMHHKDPFDRLIIAQSLGEQMAIVSADTAFDAYGVTRLW